MIMLRHESLCALPLNHMELTEGLSLSLGGYLRAHKVLNRRLMALPPQAPNKERKDPVN